MIAAALVPLLQAGLRVDIEWPNRLLVSPTDRLTNELRQYIREHKKDILMAMEGTNCRRCIHLRRPGAAYGYCSIREDLAPVYGDTHPLRHCPADGGESCSVVAFVKPH